MRAFLVDRAVERDVPSVLFGLAVEHLSSNEVRIIRPGVVSLMEEIATAREEADKEVYRRVEPLLTWTSCSPTLMFDTRAVHREDPRRRISKGEGAVDGRGDV